jgi:hypothetical protein
MQVHYMHACTVAGVARVQEVVEEEVGLARGANSLLLEVPLLPDLTHAAECTDNSLAQPSSR